MGKGNKPNKAETITADQVEQLWENGELGNHWTKWLGMQFSLSFHFSISETLLNNAAIFTILSFFCI